MTVEFSNGKKVRNLSLLQNVKVSKIIGKGCIYIANKVAYITYHVLDVYKPLNITNSRIARVAAACGLPQEFRIVLSAKVKNYNSTSWVY